MVKTLEKKSDIFVEKTKFLSFRLVTYFTFLLLPIYLQKEVNLAPIWQIIAMIFFSMFIVSQWFLLGKEIDHRLKIYFKVNSSIDRVVYRLFMGMFFMAIYFNLLSLLPHKWSYNIFWVTWVVMGLFYSWPTRGKIIKESVSTNFHEYRYLDKFEKTVLFLTVVMFFTSLPELPNLFSTGSLRLFFDPGEKVSGAFWNFISINYIPFSKYPQLLNLSWSVHFYFVTMSLFLMTFYALLRNFVSRRLSLLGVFALVSSWSFSKILANNFGFTLLTTFSVVWVWSTLWSTKSSTYRSGLFIGLLGAWGTVIDKSNIILLVVQLLLIHFVFLKEETYWYRRQFFKYTLLGVFLSISLFFFSTSNVSVQMIESINIIYAELTRLFFRKSFFILSIFGLGVFIYKLIGQTRSEKNQVLNISHDLSMKVAISILCLILIDILFSSRTFQDFSILWPLAFFSVLLIEVIFQKIRHLRSRRNMIYAVYIIICLLDSHFEGRVKILLRTIGAID